MIPNRSEKIGRNDLCPCGSKKKFKKCHGGIHAVPQPKPGQVDAQIKKSTQCPKCYAPVAMKHECTKKIIASHTVSRSGSLGLIEENGHVYSYEFSLQRIAELRGGLRPKLIGWKVASTFPGFCSHHDKSLFAPLEDAPFEGTPEQCFLLGMRSVAWELYAKVRSDRNADLRAAFAKQKGSNTQQMIALFNYVNELGMGDARALKDAYDDVLVHERWSESSALLIEFEGQFPIQCSCAWAPEMDVYGNFLQVLDTSMKSPQSVAMASFAAGGVSYLLLNWLERSSEVASKMAASIESLPVDQQPGALAALLLLTSENCHFSPRWYDDLTPAGKRWVEHLSHPFTLGKPSAAAAGGATYLQDVRVKAVRRV